MVNAYLRGTAVLGSDLLGVDGLQNQYILLRVKNIDKATLQRRLRQSPGEPQSSSMRTLKASLTGTTVSVIDRVPKAFLDLAVPFVVEMLKEDYGIDAQITVSDVPLSMRVRERSEFFPGVVVGGIAGVLLASLVWGGKQFFFGK